MSSFTLLSTINTRHNSPIDPSKSHLRSKHSESKRNEFVFRRNGKRKKSTLTRALLIASPLLFNSKIFSAHNNSNCSQHSITSQVRPSIFSSSSVETRSWVVLSHTFHSTRFTSECITSHPEWSFDVHRIRTDFFRALYHETHLIFRFMLRHETLQIVSSHVLQCVLDPKASSSSVFSFISLSFFAFTATITEIIAQ